MEKHGLADCECLSKRRHRRARFYGRFRITEIPFLILAGRSVARKCQSPSQFAVPGRKNGHRQTGNDKRYDFMACFDFQVGYQTYFINSLNLQVPYKTIATA